MQIFAKKTFALFSNSILKKILNLLYLKDINLNCGILCDFIKKYTQFLKCTLLSTIHEHFYQIQEYLQSFDTTKKITSSPRLKKRLKKAILSN